MPLFKSRIEIRKKKILIAGHIKESHQGEDKARAQVIAGGPVLPEHKLQKAEGAPQAAHRGRYGPWTVQRRPLRSLENVGAYDPP